MKLISRVFEDVLRQITKRSWQLSPSVSVFQFSVFKIFHHFMAARVISKY